MNLCIFSFAIIFFGYSYIRISETIKIFIKYELPLTMNLFRQIVNFLALSLGEPRNRIASELTRYYFIEIFAFTMNFCLNK